MADCEIEVRLEPIGPHAIPGGRAFTSRHAPSVRHPAFRLPQAAIVMLSVSDLSVSYGAITALAGISFEIAQGDIVTLIGGNGASPLPAGGTELGANVTKIKT